MSPPPSRQPSAPPSLASVIDPAAPGHQFALAHDRELARIAAEIDDAVGVVRDVLVGWRAVAKRDPVSRQSRIYLVGVGQRRGLPLATSRVLAFDRASRLARTRSGSLYALRGERLEDEPPPDHLYALQAAFSPGE